jgi:hypothetical protein
MTANVRCVADRLSPRRAASSLGPDALTAPVTAQRQGYLGELAGLTRLRRCHVGDPLVALLIEAAIAHTKADLELVESAAQRLAPLAERNARGAVRAETPDQDERDERTPLDRTS